VKVARSLVDGGAIAQGSANDRETARSISPAIPWEGRCPSVASARRLMKPKLRRRHASAPHMPQAAFAALGINRSRTVTPPLFPAWRSPHARKQPRSGRRQPRPARRRPRPETPQRRLSYAAQNCRRSPGAWCSTAPGAPLVSNVCKLLTTAPVEPSCSVGIGPPSGRAAHVAGPTIPSIVNPAPCWNRLTAVSTFGLRTP